MAQHVKRLKSVMLTGILFMAAGQNKLQQDQNANNFEANTRGSPQRTFS
jgi:hypothetical protein